MDAIKQQIKKVTQWAKHAFVSETYEKSGVRPLKDWGIILPTFFVGLLILGSFALYIDMNVQSGVFWSVSSGNRPLRTYQINQKDLSTVTDLFGRKQKNIDDLQNNLESIPPDPSL